MVRRQGLILIWALLALWACGRAGPPAEPRVRATVLTIVTTLQPQSKSFTHTIAIAGGRARSSDEVDRWRLFDLGRGRVLFVDDINRTFTVLPVKEAIARRRAAAGGALPEGAPVAAVEETGETRMIEGLEARLLRIRAGGYQRELWIAQPPGVPENLFSVWVATQSLDASYEPMMRNADEALLDIRGFPLVDRAELLFGNSRMIVNRAVVRIEQRDVPRAWLQVSAADREITAPSGNPPPASSPPAGRSTPAAGSPPFATDQRNP